MINTFNLEKKTYQESINNINNNVNVNLNDDIL